MKLVQTYETTIWEPGTSVGVTFVIVPARSFPDGSVPEQNSLVDDLGFEQRHFVSSVSPVDAAVVLAAALEVEDIEDFADLVKPSTLWDTPERSFVEAAVFDDVIPFEHSPLAAESLAGILIRGGSGAAGIGVGVAAGGTTPLLLLTVPAGVILCGAAAGIASALEQGLRAALLRRLGVEEGEPTSSSRS